VTADARGGIGVEEIVALGIFKAAVGEDLAIDFGSVSGGFVKDRGDP
jgi:hypothetical protein